MFSILAVLAACRNDDPADALPPVPAEASCTPTARVLLNEMSPSNVNVLVDVEGDSVDWIEVTNAGTEAVDLAEWGLTDDPSGGVEWTFPPLSLAPGAFQVVYASSKGWSQIVGAWDTRVDAGDTWRYLPVTATPDPVWNTPAFDDSGWATGASGFGFGDDDDATVVDARTVYVRTTVELTEEEAADLVAVYLHVDYDDSFVAYLDGTEIARADIGAAPAWDAFADSDHEAQVFEGLPPDAFEVPTSSLHAGTNVLALEVHDRTATSSDLTLVPLLTLGFGSERPARTSTLVTLPEVQLHTNFSLNASGERIRLYDPVGCEAGALDPVALTADQSYGLVPETGALGYFMEPTPGAANTTEMRPGFAPTPTFDPAPGWYAGGTDVVIGEGSSAEIHYALAGVEPDETDAIVSGPVPTGDDGEAVVLRARAWQDGLWPSPIATATYLLHAPASLPIVSVVTDPPNLWDEETGIYVLGTSHEGPPEYIGANYREDWERPVSVALWEPDGTLAFTVDGGVAIHGGYSRIHEQKSLLVELGGGYGPGEVDHALFPGLDIGTFDRFLLRAGGNDWHGCMADGCSSGAHLRDPLMQALPASEDLDVMASRPAEVYLNGVYWGIYQISERPDDSYIVDHYGEEDIDLLEGDAKAVDGDALHWQATLDYLRTHDLADPDVYAHVQTLIDLDELAAWLAFEVYYDNTDWPGNNVKKWRPRTEDGRWRWLLYDTDFGLGQYGESPSNDSLAAALDPAGEAWPNPPWSTELFRLMVSSPEFTVAFINRYADYLNTILLPDVALDELHALADEIAPEMPRHFDRWGTWTDGVTVEALDPGAWQSEIWWIDTWLQERPDEARQHVVDNFGLAGTWTLSLDADPPGSGTFYLTAAAVESPFTGVYFQGIPVTITAIAAPGYSFVGWSDPALPADRTLTVDADDALALVARFE